MPRLSDIDKESDSESVDGFNEIPSSRPHAVDQVQSELEDKVEMDTESKDEEEEEEDEDAEDGEGVYVVEKVIDHQWQGKKNKKDLKLLVKWKGYEKAEDRTWEAEENLLEGAKDILGRYYTSIGGRPSEPEANGTARKRKSNTSLDGGTGSQSAKRVKKSNGDDDEDETKQWLPPPNKAWEDYVATVQTIERDARDKELYAFLEWKNGKKTKVNIGQAYKKCPMKMLKFYEQHLVFKET